MLDAIILAGAEKVEDTMGVYHKSLLEIHGKRMIDYVIDAVRSSENIGRIIVMGSKEWLDPYLKDKVDAVVDCQGTILENLMSGIYYLGDTDRVLICSCDIPFITPEAINDFIEKSIATTADFCYPIIDKRENDKKYPGIRRTYVRIREGVFTGGNIFYINPKIVKKGLPLVERMLRARKNPLKMAILISPGFIIRLLLGILGVENIEKRFSSLLQLNGKAIISTYPEIGNDIDKPEDIKFAIQYLAAEASD